MGAEASGILTWKEIHIQFSFKRGDKRKMGLDNWKYFM